MEAIFLVNRRKPLMTRMTVIIALLLFIPFCQIFMAMSQAETFHSCLNYLGFSLAVVAFPAMISRLNRRVVLLCAFGAVIYSLNFLLGPFASAKWFVNTLGFLFIFMVISNYMKTMNCEQRVLIERHFGRLMSVLWFACACICVLTLCTYWAEIAAFTTTLRFNNSIYMLTQDYGISKQSLGLFFSATALWHIVCRESLGRVSKVLFAFFVILAIPFFIGIRTLLLALALLSLFLLWSSKRITCPTKLVVFVLVPIALVVAIVWRDLDVTSVVLRRYNRLPSVLFAVETFRQHPWGVGNGGYTPYVIPQANALFAQYAAGTYGLIRFPLAPESDIVYFIASFGVLCPVFFLLYIHILNKASHILHFGSPHRFEKFLLLFAVILIFGGISQDFAGKLAWWTYLGAATGIIFRYRTASPMVEQAVALLPKWDGRMSRCPAQS